MGHAVAQLDLSQKGASGKRAVTDAAAGQDQFPERRHGQIVPGAALNLDVAPEHQFLHAGINEFLPEHLQGARKSDRFEGWIAVWICLITGIAEDIVQFLHALTDRQVPKRGIRSDIKGTGIPVPAAVPRAQYSLSAADGEIRQGCTVDNDARPVMHNTVREDKGGQRGAAPEHFVFQLTDALTKIHLGQRRTAIEGTRTHRLDAVSERHALKRRAP